MATQPGVHPDLEAEQAYIDHAYASLEAARERALSLRRLTEIGPGGTHQARYESEMGEDAIRARLSQLEFGDAALVFGRIDPDPGALAEGDAPAAGPGDGAEPGE